jgi:hypothetical protein
MGIDPFHFSHRPGEGYRLTPVELSGERMVRGNRNGSHGDYENSSHKK